MKRNSVLFLSFAVVMVFSLSETLFAQGTAFTYQGRLNTVGGPANGGYDLMFTVYDSTNEPGTIVAGPLTNSVVGVSNGLFTVTLDFGSGVFDGNPRWLEIGVRTNGSGSFTTLSPRQAFLPAPYAIAAGNLIGPLPASQLSGVYTNAVIFNNPGDSFAGNGGGLTNLNAGTAQSATTATQLGTSNSQAVIYGQVSNIVDIVSVTPILTNYNLGGPYWQGSNYYSGNTLWQFFEPPVGTNIYGVGAFPLFTTGNQLHVTPHNNIQTIYADFSYPGCPLPDYYESCYYEGQGVSYYFNVNADGFAWESRGGTFAIYVNGVEYPTRFTLPTGDRTYFVKFATKALRKIQLVVVGSASGQLSGIFVAPTNEFIPHTSPPLKRLIVIGDSRSEVAPPYCTTAQDFGTQLGLLMPALDVWCYGMGGTGYTNRGSGRLNFQQRVPIDIGSNQPTYVLFKGGGNDAGMSGVGSNDIFLAASNTFWLATNASPATVFFGMYESTSTPNGDAPAATAIYNAWVSVFGNGTNWIDTLGLLNVSPFPINNAAYTNNTPWVTGTSNVPGSGNAPDLVAADGAHWTPLGQQFSAAKVAAELAKRGVP